VQREVSQWYRGRIYLLRSTALNLVENLNRSAPFVGSDSIFFRRAVQN
jgi:hypothetical protein